MLISIPNVIFACLSLASAGASLSNGDLLKMIEEQEGSTQEMKKMIYQQQKTIDQLVESGRSSNGIRRFKGGTQNKGNSDGRRALKSSPKGSDKDRSICYSNGEEGISAFVDCAPSTTFCANDRRVLTHDEVRRRNDEDCINRGNSTIEHGFHELGKVKIEKDESFMVELTATTITLDVHLREIIDASFLAALKFAGVYVTVSMFEGTKQILPEPMTWIPIRVQETVNIEEFEGDFGESTFGLTENTETSAAKLFFPASNLAVGKDGTEFSLTLEFKAQAAIFSTSCDSTVGYFFGASLGPYIIDAEIIKDADFGNCGWLDPTKPGCGLFDEPSAEVDCEDVGSS